MRRAAHAGRTTSGVLLAAIACAACGGAEPGQRGGPGSDDMFGRKRPAAPTTVNPILGAELRQVTGFPAGAPGRPPSSRGPGSRKVRVDGAPPQAALIEDADATTPNAGFVIPGRAPFAFVNRTGEFRFEVWQLDPGGALRLTAKLPVAAPAAGKSEMGTYVHNAAFLPNDRVLLTIGHYDPRPKPVLYVYDATAPALTRIADADADVQDPYRYYEVGVLGADAALVIHYSGQTRKAAEIYHNYYNHLRLFTADHPQGIEIVKLGIDQGNVVDWTVLDRTLYLRTLDLRERDHPKETFWALDLSRVLKG